jgi:hypothetical protein
VTNPPNVLNPNVPNEPADPNARTADEIAADAAALARKTSPRGDLLQSLGWIVLGFATTIGAWRMDRLEKQDINPYTIPGLLPGFLGVALVFFGALMLYRSWRRAAALVPTTPRAATEADRAETRRLWAVIALCVAFALGLVGHGPPFWLAAALFVTLMTGLLRLPEYRATDRVRRGLALAAVTGLIAGVVIQLVFQEFFLVRLP